MEQESKDFSLCMETEMFHPSGSYYQDPVPQLIFFGCGDLDGGQHILEVVQP